jgi:LPXTG-motif cell wall-anchored protein
MRRSLIPAGALVAAMATSLVLAPAAFAAEVPFHHEKDLPIVAADFPDKGTCPGIEAGQDGWHFVLPGKATFTELTVTFEPGGTTTITDFSVFAGAKGKHAYVASEPGATLISASAEVDGATANGDFNLSHTCPADGTTPGGPGGGGDGGDSGDDGGNGDGDNSGDGGNGGNGDGGNSGDDGDKSGDKPGQDEGSTPTAPAEAGGESAGAGATDPAASESPAAGVSGDLAETGNGAPVGVLAAVAAALVAGGGYLLARRRTARQH